LLYASRFDFKIIGEIFNVWAAEEDAKQLSFDLQQLPVTYSFPYIYDSLQYRSTVWLERSREVTKGKQFTTIHIKLSNDGFLYTDSEELRLRRSNIKRHKSKTWCLLDDVLVVQWFGPMIKYACDKISPESSDDVVIQVFYNYEEERIDFKFYDNVQGKAIVITLEPGYPENEFKDEWMKKVPLVAKIIQENKNKQNEEANKNKQNDALLDASKNNNM